MVLRKAFQSWRTFAQSRAAEKDAMARAALFADRAVIQRVLRQMQMIYAQHAHDTALEQKVLLFREQMAVRRVLRGWHARTEQHVDQRLQPLEATLGTMHARRQMQVTWQAWRLALQSRAVSRSLEASALAFRRRQMLPAVFAAWRLAFKHHRKFSWLAIRADTFRDARATAHTFDNWVAAVGDKQLLTQQRYQV